MIIGITILVCSVIAMGVIWTSLVAHRRRMAHVVVTVLRMAVRSGQPLVVVVGNAALVEQGKVGRRLRDLFMGLDDGVLVAHCLDDVPELTRGERGLIDAAERQGQLEVGLAQLERRLALDTAAGRSWNSGVVDWIYPVIVIAMCFLVLSSLLVFVVPSFAKIASDFDMDWPVWLEIMEYQSWASNWSLVLTLGGFLLVAAAVALPIVPAFWAYFKKGPGLDSFGARILWWIPGFGRAVRDGAYSDALLIIGISVKGGQTMDEAVRSAVEAELNPVLTARLQRWREGIVVGEAISTSASRSGISGIVSTMLGNATRTGGMAETLIFLSEYFEARRSRRLTWLRAAVLPVMTVIVAVPVGIVGYGVIQFSVLLIDTAIGGVTW